jgi:hypothetical protein
LAELEDFPQLAKARIDSNSSRHCRNRLILVFIDTERSVVVQTVCLY